MKNRSLEVRPVASAIGAEIDGVDLAKPLTDGLREEIRSALLEYGVIFFRNQKITPAQQVDFARNFGELAALRTPSKEHPYIAEVRKEPDATRNTGGNWHTDEAYTDTPDMGTILLAREIPEAGGDTMFANMYNAYDMLSDGMKKTLQDLRGIHAKATSFDPRNLTPDRRYSQAEIAATASRHQKAVHPVTPRHPENGRHLLYVSPTYTGQFEGWTEEESRPLLQYLFDHAARPENTCRFRWEVGSLAFWDNRAVWHRALNDYHGSRRLMHRVAIAGKGFGLN
jgi:taurine dioxygenase